MNKLKLRSINIHNLSFLCILISITITGCAHQISITAEDVKVNANKRYPFNVGYIIPDARMDQKIITPAGGGDKVEYYPYKDMVRPLTSSLENIFLNARRLQSLQESKNYTDIFLIFEPTIKTDSSSSSSFSWPPEKFTINLETDVYDNAYNKIFRTEGRGTGTATRQEWRTDSGFAGKRAMEMALKDLIINLDHEIDKTAGLIPESLKNAINTHTPMLPLGKVKSDVDDLPSKKVMANKNAYAIVIGIESYRQKLPKADFATHDAQTMTEYLTKVMGYPEENVVTLLNDNASKSDFEKYFGKWLSNNVEKGGSVFVYYSGHGAPNVKTGDTYLVPYDGDPAFIDETGYSLKKLYEQLGKLEAKEIVVALDSCFSGAGGRSVLAKGARPLVMNNSVIPPKVAVLSAASGEQISSTYDEKGHGLFTYFLLKGLKGEAVTNGSVEIGTLFEYIKPQVERIARKSYNNEQTPQLIAPKELLGMKLR